MEEGMKTVLVCEDSMEGILTAIYVAYECKKPLGSITIQVEGEGYPSLFTEYIPIKNDEIKAMKVSRTLRAKIGEEHYFDFCLILSSNQEGKAQGAFAVVKWLLKNQIGKTIFDHLTDDDIMCAFSCYRNVNFELMHLRGFVRFSEMENGSLLAEIEPKNNIVLYLADHFADRLPMENFVIVDKRRNLYAIHPAQKEYFLMQRGQEEQGLEEQIACSDEEAQYQALFKTLCQSLTIKERENKTLQRTMLPLRFRPYMTEFKKN